MMTEPRRMTTAAARWVRRAGAAGAAIALLSNVAMAATSSSHGKSNSGGCINACHRQWVSDGGACTSRDPACLGAARAKYDACVVACSKPQHTTTTTRPRPTTTTTSLRPTTTTSTTTTTVSTTSVPKPVSTTTTTLKRPTTTTTTLVVGFSQATAACIKVATADKKVCLASASTADCQAEYDTSFASCFAPGKGVACAASCLAKKAKCTTTKTSGSSTSRTTCVSDCHKQWINAGAQCGGANQACLAAARVAYDTCAAGCTNVPGSCGAALSTCLAKCANL